MKKNLIAIGVLAAIAVGLLLIQIAVELLRPHAAKLWLALIGVSVAALVILLGVHFASGS